MCDFKDNALDKSELLKSRAPTLLSQKALLFNNPQPITPPPARALPGHIEKQSQPQQLVLTSCNCFSKYGEDIKTMQTEKLQAQSAAANRSFHYFN